MTPYLLFGSRRLAVAPDGQRFLLLKNPTATGTAEASWAQINVVLSWFEELKERVPIP